MGNMRLVGLFSVAIISAEAFTVDTNDVGRIREPERLISPKIRRPRSKSGSSSGSGKPKPKPKTPKQKTPSPKPKTPKKPKSAKSPKTPKSPESPKTPKSPETPQSPKTPEPPGHETGRPDSHSPCKDCIIAGVNQQNMINVNYAPVNKNEQNFVNIKTEIETEVDVSINKKPCEFFDWLFGKCD